MDGNRRISVQYACYGNINNLYPEMDVNIPIFYNTLHTHTWILATENPMGRVLMPVWSVYTLFFIFLLTEKPLNDYISYYETLSYDETQTHASHNRAKRSVTKDPYVFLKFRAHSRPFHIRLKRDLVTFSDSLVVSICGGSPLHLNVPRLRPFNFNGIDTYVGTIVMQDSIQIYQYLVRFSGGYATR